jgi:hypothetical protein
MEAPPLHTRKVRTLGPGQIVAAASPACCSINRCTAGALCNGASACTAGRLQRLRSLEVLKSFSGRDGGYTGFKLSAGLSHLTALTRLAVSVSYIEASVLQLTGLRSLMLHRLQVGTRSYTLHCIKPLVGIRYFSGCHASVYQMSPWLGWAAKTCSCGVSMLQHTCCSQRLFAVLTVCGAVLQLLQSCSGCIAHVWIVLTVPAEPGRHLLTAAQLTGFLPGA